ncbi:MAG TPA: hypothetical protein VGE98_01050 [Thermoanaerobaculia bacterium]
MKKQKMERLSDPLFQPLTNGEAADAIGGQVHTNFISLIPTGGGPIGSDVIRDAG